MYFGYNGGAEVLADLMQSNQTVGDTFQSYVDSICNLIDTPTIDLRDPTVYENDFTKILTGWIMFSFTENFRWVSYYKTLS